MRGSKLTDDFKLGGIADRPYWCAAIQGNLGRLEKCQNITKFCQEHYEIQQGEMQSPAPEEEQTQAATLAGDSCLESILAEEDLGLLVHIELNISQQHALAAHKANNTLGCIE